MPLNVCQQWSAVISAGINDLVQMQVDANIPFVFRTYGSAILAFLQNNVVELKRLNEMNSLKKSGVSDVEHDAIKLLIQLRLQLRVNEIQLPLINKLLTSLPKGSFFDGEIHFVVAMCYEKLNRLDEAKLFYESARNELAKIECSKKSLRCKLNFLSCESRLHPDQNYTAD